LFKDEIERSSPFIRGLFCWLISRSEIILRAKIPFSTRSPLAIELKDTVAVVQKIVSGVQNMNLF